MFYTSDFIPTITKGTNQLPLKLVGGEVCYPTKYGKTCKLGAIEDISIDWGEPPPKISIKSASKRPEEEMTLSYARILSPPWTSEIGPTQVEFLEF